MMQHSRKGRVVVEARSNLFASTQENRMMSPNVNRAHTAKTRKTRFTAREDPEGTKHHSRQIIIIIIK